MDPETASTPERSAVLIVRVLLDGAPPTGLQARLTRSLDVVTRDHQVTTASTIDEVCDGVRTWLEAFILDQDASRDAPITVVETPP